MQATKAVAVSVVGLDGEGRERGDDARSSRNRREKEREGDCGRKGRQRRSSVHSAPLSPHSVRRLPPPYHPLVRNYRSMRDSHGSVIVSVWARQTKAGGRERMRGTGQAHADAAAASSTTRRCRRHAAVELSPSSLPPSSSRQRRCRRRWGRRCGRCGRCGRCRRVANRSQIAM